MTVERFIELRRLPGAWPTRPLTVEPHHSGYRHVCDANGNVVAAVPDTAADFAERIVEALAVIPELLEEVGRLRPELVEASANATADEWIRALKG